MNDEFKKSMENVVLCSEAIDELSKSLNRYTEAYGKIRDTLTEFHNLEKQASADIYETVPQMQAYIADFDRSQKEFSELLEHASPVFKKTAALLQTAEDQLKGSAELLASHQETFQQIYDTLSGIDTALSEIPQLTQISAHIQSALGAMGDLDSLDRISQKLETQISAIHQEREEIIAPLKNAAAFSEVVHCEYEQLKEEMTAELSVLRAENADLLNAHFSALTSNTPDSLASKLDFLLSVTQDIQHKVISMEENHGKNSGISGIFGRKPKDPPTSVPSFSLQTLFQRSICIVEKKGWYDDYVFVIEQLQDNYAVGHIYKQGIYQKPDRIDLDSQDFHFYKGPYRDQVAVAEFKRKFQ